MSYTERTQVLLSKAQREKVERLAARTRRSVGAVIREAIDAYEQPDAGRRREAYERLTSLDAPVADWREMEAQIERGAGG